MREEEHGTIPHETIDARGIGTLPKPAAGGTVDAVKGHATLRTGGPAAAAAVSSERTSSRTRDSRSTETPCRYCRFLCSRWPRHPCRYRRSCSGRGHRARTPAKPRNLLRVFKPVPLAFPRTRGDYTASVRAGFGRDPGGRGPRGIARYISCGRGARAKVQQPNEQKKMDIDIFLFEYLTGAVRDPTG